MQKPIYNLVFGKVFYPDYKKLQDFSPNEFVICGYVFKKSTNFSNAIENLYYPTTDSLGFSFEITPRDKEFFDSMRSNPELAESVLKQVQEEYDSGKILQKNEIGDLKDIAEAIGAEYYHKEYPENIGAHQITYIVEIPAAEEKSTIVKDGTLLDDILLLLTLFTGTRTLRYEDITRHWQKNNLDMLDYNHRRISSNIEEIIDKFRKTDFNFELHGKNLFYYQELNSTQLIDLQLLILCTSLDFFGKYFAINNETKFNSFMESIKDWNAINNNTKRSFSNNLFFLMSKTILDRLSISVKEKYYLSTVRIFELRNQIIHSGRLFPVQMIGENLYTLSDDLKKADKYMDLFPFTRDNFTYETYFQEVLDNYYFWKNVYIYAILSILEIEDWHTKAQMEKTIITYLE